MGNDLERNKAEHAVLSAVEKARGVPDLVSVVSQIDGSLVKLYEGQTAA